MRNKFYRIDKIREDNIYLNRKKNIREIVDDPIIYSKVDLVLEEL